jgi:flavin-dependent dehydrogenase
MRLKPRKPDYDAVIVGASVAGCRTALTLAHQGAAVLLLDRAGFPRWKPCAGGLTLKTRPYLPDPLFDRVEGTVQDAYLALG